MSVGGVGISLTDFDQLLDILKLGGEIAKLQGRHSIGRVFALDRADGRCVCSRRDEEDRVLATVLSFAENLHGSLEYDLAYLRTKILKRAPTNCVER
ncbi:hypothetical protein PSAB6_460039 [Paraburkholderia sabiae]|nr:hypothetical protein PSAB6_460039 [Paraburkholderia sabiae]